MRQTDVPSQDSRQRRPNLRGVQPDVAQFAAVRKSLTSARRLSVIEKSGTAPFTTRLPVALRMMNNSVFQTTTADQVGKLQNKIIPEHARERLLIVNDSVIQFETSIYVSYGLVPTRDQLIEQSAPIRVFSSNNTGTSRMVFDEPRSGNYLQNASAVSFRSQNIGDSVSQDQICVSWISFTVGDVIDIKIFEGFRA